MKLLATSGNKIYAETETLTYNIWFRARKTICKSNHV